MTALAVSIVTTIATPFPCTDSSHELYYGIFKPAHFSLRPALVWFLKIDLVQTPVCVHVCVCLSVCLSAPKARPE